MSTRASRAPARNRDRHPDRGFTLVEVLIAIVLVGITSTVAVVGVQNLTGKGANAACAASKDAATAGATAHLAINGMHPATIAEMVTGNELTLPDGVSLDGTGLVASGSGWTLTMSTGVPPTFVCSESSGSPTSSAPSSAPPSATSTTPPTAPPTSTPAPTTTLFAGPTEPMRVCLADSTGAPQAGATLMIYAGAWYTVGTSSASCLDADVPDSTSAVAVSHRGVYRQVDWSAGSIGGATTTFSFATQPHAVRLVDSTGQGIAGASASFYAGSWQAVGTTDATGCAVTELLAGYLTFGIAHRGMHEQLSMQTQTSPTAAGCGTAPVYASFQTQPKAVRLVDSAGQGIAGATAAFYAGGWQTLGPTDTNGCASTELLTGSISFAITHRGVYEQIDLNTTTAITTAGCGPPAVYATFQTAPRFAKAVGATGQPLAGQVVTFYAGAWQPFGTTGTDGCVSAELLSGNIAFETNVGGTWYVVGADLDATPLTSCATAAVLGP